MENDPPGKNWLKSYKTIFVSISKRNKLAPTQFDSNTSDDNSSQTPQNNTVTTQLSQTQNHHTYITDPTASAAALAHQLALPAPSAQLRRLHSYPSGSDTDTPGPTHHHPHHPQHRTAIPPNSIATHNVHYNNGNGTAAAGAAAAATNGSAACGKPPVPERNAELLTKVAGQKRVPPPPPPRTSSRSPLASPTSPGVSLVRSLATVAELSTANVELHAGQMNGGGGDAKHAHGHNNSSTGNGSTGNVAAAVAAIRAQAMAASGNVPASAASAAIVNDNSGHSSGSESTHSQEHGARIAELNHRQDVLLLKQKELHQQYARLQQLSKNSPVPVPPAGAVAPNSVADLLKKTGSESNLPQKMGLNLAVSGGGGGGGGGSMRNINAEVKLQPTTVAVLADGDPVVAGAGAGGGPMVSTTKHYSTEIL